MKALLDALLAERGYAYVRPRDRLVFYNFRAVGARWPGLRRGLADLSAAGTRWYRLWSAQARARYFGARDRLARAAPWARTLLRRGRLRRPGFHAPSAPGAVRSGAASPSTALGDLE